MIHWTDPLREIACDELIDDGKRYNTFADWWGFCNNSAHMLKALLQMRYSDHRTIRLIAYRCIQETRVDEGRTVWDLLSDERSLTAVEVAKRYIEGHATDSELKSAHSAALNVAIEMSRQERAERKESSVYAAWTAIGVTSHDLARIMDSCWEAAGAAGWEIGVSECDTKNAIAYRALAQQAGIIRDMIPATEIAPLFERYIQTRQG